jgi:8-oxo-dGTP diphosphatase
MKLEVLYKSAVNWKDERCDLIHCNFTDFSHIPNEKIQKVHGVCFRDGKMLVVYHHEWDIWGIPGGTREDGEELLDTLKREIQEETSCLLLDASPIAYQEIKHNDGTSYYALFYHCEIDINGVFKEDVAGAITKQEWIDPEEYDKYIEEKPFRKKVIEDALAFRKKNQLKNE